MSLPGEGLQDLQGAEDVEDGEGARKEEAEADWGVGVGFVVLVGDLVTRAFLTSRSVPFPGSLQAAERGGSLVAAVGWRNEKEREKRRRERWAVRNWGAGRSIMLTLSWVREGAAGYSGACKQDSRVAPHKSRQRSCSERRRRGQTDAMLGLSPLFLFR
ncbi:hypothetical protein VTI74DRAFT_6622 [Chaetomium olivicolor]